MSSLVKGKWAPLFGSMLNIKRHVHYHKTNFSRLLFWVFYVYYRSNIGSEDVNYLCCLCLFLITQHKS